MKLLRESVHIDHCPDKPKKWLELLIILLLIIDLAGNGLALAGQAGGLSDSNLIVAQKSAKKKEPAPKLPEKYKKWLEQEVVYIITPTEREIFLKLKTDRERDLFIEAFWKHRDPIPETEENEFKIEHYKRIEYANKYFGREAAKPGWMTDRGRMYIILGPPNDIQHIDGKSEIYNCEIWFYQGKQEMGLPPGFNLLFYQEKGTGEMRLYSPTSDGPQALLTSYWGDPADYTTAYSNLREVDPNLANISLSLIPGEENVSMGRPSLSSDLLLRQIEQTPQKMVADRYARKFFEYKDIIDVDYSVNYIDSDSLVRVLKDPSGLYFIHYDIEPSRLSVNQYDNQYATNFKVNGLLSTIDGKMVYQFEKTFPVKLTSAQFKERQNLPLAIYDVVPCVPGEYKLSVLVKNEASKEFTSLEQTIRIPEKVQIEMTTPILAYRVSPSESTEGKIKAFLLGSQQLYLQASRVFTSRDQLVVALQIFGLTPELKNKASLRYQFFKESQPFKEETYPVSELGMLPDLIKVFSLADFSPAHYFLNITLLIDGQEKLTVKDEFDLTYLETLPRPWVLSRVLPPASDPYYGWILGNQLYNLGRLAEARTVLEPAMAKAPGNQDLAMELARVYVGLKDYEKAAKILDSFVSAEQGVRYETYFVAAQAFFNIGQYEKALNILDKAVAQHGTDIQLLDLIGDCYLKLGKKEEALAVWQKSLEINPEQPEVKKKIQAVR
ncbi:MAG: tetratricopeptide repeat protein [Candidatus Saccharicenans sp.]|nr:tetratricopeptide repeat protein [Candidatus Saccharicenans sp.]